MTRRTLWIQERGDGKLKATLEKPAEITGRLIAVTIEGDDAKFVDVTDGGFFTVPIE